ncbi:MAG: LamG-like jellyroll fold domain-containing protein [Bacteroidota bacterium]
MCKTKKNNKSAVLRLLLLSTLLIIHACGDDDETQPDPVVTVNGFSLTIDENPMDGTVLGTIQATTDRGDITLEISEQSPSGALALEEATGTITVADSALFDFEVNPQITAVVKATVGSVEETANITIDLNDIKELNIGENGLIAYYSFDNTLSDSLGNFPNLTVQGSGSPSLGNDRNGESQKSYQFGAAQSSYFSLPAQDELVDTEKTFTLSIWVNPQGQRQQMKGVIHKEFDYKLHVSAGAFINPVSYRAAINYGLPGVTANEWGQEIRVGSSNSTLGSVPRLGRWSHIALVCDGAKVRMYRDGVQVYEADVIADTFINSNSELWLAAIPNSETGDPESFYEGFLDDFRYYNQALTEEQVRKLAEI